VALLFLPAQYFYGAFTHDSFLAQTAATFFAVAAWWALVAWDRDRSIFLAIVISFLLVAVFLTWPVFVGPLVVVYVAVTLSVNDPPKPDEALAKSGRRRTTPLLIGVAPVFLIAAMHLYGRWGWLGMVRTSGAVLAPSVASLGWLLPVLALIGLLISARDRDARVSLVLLLVIALQALTLFVLARARGASTPYMAFKMVYLAIYPMAVFGAIAMGRLRSSTIGWILASVLVLIAVRPALTAPRTLPVVDLDLYEAGKWVRANVG